MTDEPHHQSASATEKRCNHCYRTGHIAKDCPERAKSAAFSNRRAFDALYGDRKIGRRESDEGTPKRPEIGPEYDLVFDPKFYGGARAKDTGSTDSRIDWSRIAETDAVDAAKRSEDPMANYRRK